MTTKIVHDKQVLHDEQSCQKLIAKFKKKQKKYQENKKLVEQQAQEHKLQIKKLQEQLQNLQGQLQKQKIIVDNQKKSMRFCGGSQILTNQQQSLLYKHFCIDKYSLNLKYVKTKLIYRFDPLNKHNFHLYFDNLDHLLVLSKTVKGRLVGAYSSTGIKQNKKEPDQFSELFSANQEDQQFSHYYVSNPDHSTEYSQFFLIFGNSEFRLKTGEKKLFSNLGIVNGFYGKNQNNKDKWMQYIGTQKDHQIQLESYQIFQIVFESQSKEEQERKQPQNCFEERIEQKNNEQVKYEIKGEQGVQKI